ncbi:MAG: hypothetical protein ACKV2O_05495 [Acidimicrobiales bacterium]
MNAPQRFRNLLTLPRRTGLITAAAVAAVITSGAAAVGANVGILNLASGTTTGKLSADELTVANVATGANLQASGVTVPAGQPQLFQVSNAGTVSLAVLNNQLTLVAIQPAAGWTATVVESGARSLEASFTNGTRTVSFQAEAEDNGRIETEVRDSSSSSSSSTSSTSTTAGSGASTSTSTSTSMDDDDDGDDDSTDSSTDSSIDDDDDEDSDDSSEDSDRDDRDEDSQVRSTTGTTSSSTPTSRNDDRLQGGDDDD